MYLSFEPKFFISWLAINKIERFRAYARPCRVPGGTNVNAVQQQWRLLSIGKSILYLDLHTKWWVEEFHQLLVRFSEKTNFLWKCLSSQKIRLCESTFLDRNRKFFHLPFTIFMEIPYACEKNNLLNRPTSQKWIIENWPPELSNSYS